MKSLHLATFLLLVVGGVNWGLVGLFDLNLVEAIFGAWPALVRLVYVLVGLSGVYELATHKEICRACMEMMKGK
jgi:uncharacterized membrane protein YuzA (DUF378 family)